MRQEALKFVTIFFRINGGIFLYFLSFILRIRQDIFIEDKAGIQSNSSYTSHARSGSNSPNTRNQTKKKVISVVVLNYN